jgi:hypothetical protein
MAKETTRSCQPRLNKRYFNQEGLPTNSKPIEYFMSAEDYKMTKKQAGGGFPRVRVFKAHRYMEKD